MLKILQEYQVDGQLLVTIISLYDYPRLNICIGGATSKSFKVCARLRQRCALLLLICITFMDWIDMRSNVTIFELQDESFSFLKLA